MTYFTQDQIAQYKKDGFITLPQLLSPREITRFVDEINRIQEGGDTGGKTLFYYESPPQDPKQKRLKRIERLSEASDLIRKFLEGGKLLGCVEELFGEPAVLFKDKINYKKAGAQGFPFHFDGHFFWQNEDGRIQRGWEEYASDFISVSISLDPATKENGCLEIARLGVSRPVFGKGLGEICPKLYKNKHLTQEQVDQLTLTPILVTPGDVTFFSWHNVHGSNPNRSNSHRRIIFSTYNPRKDGDQRSRYYNGKSKSQGSDKGFSREY